ncbi:MAG: FAD-dependent oxidoreductase [Holophagales bacterium]|nr:FAD-dependent oxidoreductase [Holophagales bacterium]
MGGGNSAIDAARVAVRQEGVEKVTLLYRRTREEMPAFEEEVEAAVHEGMLLVPLASPVRILTEGGRVTGVECIQNALGERDASGRPRPVPIAGSEFTVPLETLIVAISEGSDTDCVAVAGANRIATTPTGTVKAERETLTTNRPGVFAGGDVVTGPNTVVDAIAAGKRAAVMIDRYLRSEALSVAAAPRLPEVFVAPPEAREGEEVPRARVEAPRLPVSQRARSFAEVEVALSGEDASREARRCLRCDLTFTRGVKEKEEVPELAMAGGVS